MNRILITLAVLILLYPFVPWGAGFLIEQRVESLADRGQEIVPQLHLTQKTRHGFLTSDADSSYDLGSTLKVTRHYHRGWYNSVDEASVEMPGTALDALAALRSGRAPSSGGSDSSPLRFSLRTVIQHGPFCGSNCFGLAGAETHVSLTGLLQASLKGHE